MPLLTTWFLYPGLLFRMLQRVFGEKINNNQQGSWKIFENDQEEKKCWTDRWVCNLFLVVQNKSSVTSINYLLDGTWCDLLLVICIKVKITVFSKVPFSRCQNSFFIFHSFRYVLERIPRYAICYVSTQNAI